MHIAEGYLPIAHCVAWGAACAPSLLTSRSRAGAIAPDQRATHRAALVGAVAFGVLLTSLKLPSVAGSSSHPTGLALGTLLIGPNPMAAVALGILAVQALFLAHGGLTTIGANLFALGIAGPWLVWGVWRLLRAAGAPVAVAIGLSAIIGDLGTYLVTATQLALAHPGASGDVAGAFRAYAGVFAITQLPIAFLEGVLTVLAWRALHPEAASGLPVPDAVSG